ncbi:MAG: BMP family ABC transporter substrate-binding protein [Leptolyngbya sp. SIO1D8]|nr:BMP family ABC transporter substrate-binding protein [Leptolyngbya sp. SIO1D8]
MPHHRRPRFTRRQVVRGLMATTAFGVVTKFGTACSSEPSDPADAESGGGDGDFIVGFIYVGPKDDFGYNQAHAEGAAAMAANVSGIKIVEEASVPETSAVAETMRSMIEIDGAKVLFPTSFGYFDPYILELATEFPDVQFFHAGGLYQEGEHPENVGSYFGYIDEAQYVAGIVAGHMTQSGKLGFVAAKPIPQVLRNINSFTLGAKSIKPEITTQVIFTGDWAEPVKEAEATNSMVDQGIDVVTCHVDSKEGVDCTVIDLRCTSPLDEESICESVEETGRVVIVDEGYPRCGFAADVAALVATTAFASLRAPVKTVTPPHTTIPFAPVLEDMYIPSVGRIKNAAKETLV